MTPLGYLVNQIALFSIVTAALGLLAGWLLARLSYSRREAALRNNLEATEEEISAAGDQWDADRRALEAENDRARVRADESTRDLAVIIGERDRALTRAVGLQEEVEALSEAFRERNERIRELQEGLDDTRESSAANSQQELMRLRSERDLLRRQLDAKPE